MREEKWLLIGSGITWLLAGLLVLMLVPMSVFADAADRVERELEATDAVIERATEIVEESGNEEAIELLAEAVEIQAEAYEAFEEESFEEASRLTLQARTMARNAARMVDGDHPDSLDIERYIEQVERFLEQNQELIERLGPVITESGNEEAEELFDRGVELQNDAMEAFESEDYRTALRLAKQARLLIVRAGRIVGGEHDLEEKARRELERTDNLIEEVGDEILDSDNETAIDLFNHGVDIQDNAHAMFEEGNYREAIRLTREATVLIRRAYRMVSGGDLDPERVADILARTDELIERAEPIITESDNEEAIELFNEGVELHGEAQEAFEEGNYEEAARLDQEARRMITHALRMVEDRPELTEELVQRAIDATNELIDEVSGGIYDSGNEEAIELLEEAIEHQEEAVSLLEEDDLEGAMAETRIARQLLQRAARMAGVLPGGTE